MGTRAQQNGAQMCVGESLKLAKSLIAGSGCDLNVPELPGNRPLVRVLSDGKGSHFLGKLLKVMGLSELYAVAG